VTSAEHYDELRNAGGIVCFIYINPVIPACAASLKIFDRLASESPDKVHAIVHKDTLPGICAHVNIWPTFKTWSGKRLVDSYSSVDGEDAMRGNFDRLWARLERERIAAEKKAHTTASKANFDLTSPTTKVVTIPGQVSDRPPGLNVGITSMGGPTPSRPNATQQMSPKSAPVPSQRHVAITQGPREPGPVRAQPREALTNQMVYGVDPAKTGGEYKWSTTPKLVQISSAGRHFWGLDSHGMVWKWTGEVFQQVTGQFRQLSVSADGHVWGVNFTNDVYRNTPYGWELVSGTKLKQVSIAYADCVWGITPQEEVVRYKGNHQWEAVQSQTGF